MIKRWLATHVKIWLVEQHRVLAGRQRPGWLATSTQIWLDVHLNPVQTSWPIQFRLAA
jgi:hypothetical protein